MLPGDQRLYVPQSLVAKIFGVTRQAVGYWEIEPAEKNGKGHIYYLPDVLAWWKRTKGRNDDAGPRLDPQQERAKLDEARRIKTEIETRRLDGDLLDRADVEKRYFDAGRTVRDGMLGIPARLAPILASLDDPDEIERRLTEEMRKALEVLSKNP